MAGSFVAALVAAVLCCGVGLLVKGVAAADFSIKVINCAGDGSQFDPTISFDASSGHPDFLVVVRIQEEAFNNWNQDPGSIGFQGGAFFRIKPSDPEGIAILWNQFQPIAEVSSYNLTDGEEKVIVFGTFSVSGTLVSIFATQFESGSTNEGYRASKVNTMLELVDNTTKISGSSMAVLCGSFNFASDMETGALLLDSYNQTFPDNGTYFSHDSWFWASPHCRFDYIDPTTLNCDPAVSGFTYSTQAPQERSERIHSIGHASVINATLDCTWDNPTSCSLMANFDGNAPNDTVYPTPPVVSSSSSFVSSSSSSSWWSSSSSSSSSSAPPAQGSSTATVVVIETGGGGSASEVAAEVTQLLGVDVGQISVVEITPGTFEVTVINPDVAQQLVVLITQCIEEGAASQQ